MGVVGYLGVLRRQWLALVVCVLAGIAGAISLTRSTPETYRSSARLFVNVPAARGLQEALQGVQLTTGLLRSYAEVATSRLAAQRVIDELDLDESAASLAGQLSAVPQEDTLLITVSAEDRDAARAERLANAAATVFIDLVDDLERGRDEKTEARLIDEATRPSDPIEPRPQRNLLLGILAGLAAGVGVALLLEALDRTVKTQTQAELAIGHPVLALVPRRRHGSELVTVDGTSDAASEAYRSLRTSLRFLGAEQPLRSILVTSPLAGEGKSCTAANLAIAFAQSGARVILIDADLRRGRVAELFGIEPDVGLSSVLTGKVDVRSALVPTVPHLRVLVAGPHVPNPAELIGSRAMADVLRDVDDSSNDVVIIDAPPVVPVTDAVALSTQVDSVVVVIRSGRTRRDHAEETARRLNVVGANVVGSVLNAVPRAGARYGRTYRYGIAPRRDLPKDAPATS